MGACIRARRAAGLFPPEDEAREAVLDRLSRPPTPQSCSGGWTLAQARTHCLELASLKTDSGTWRRLQSWAISWKCGRIHLISPDPEYESKLAAIHALRAAADENPEKLRVLYVDEASFYRLPHAGRTYGASGGGGKAQPTASHSPGANTRRRMVGAIDIFDGCVLSQTGSVIGVKELCRFLRQIRRHYGPDVRLVLIWDNWPVHYHPEIVRVAQMQRIELFYTPTYAPWCNPIEKLWKKLRHDVLRLHDRSGAWKLLRAAVESYLTNLRRANPDLLRYTGLAKALQA